MQPDSTPAVSRRNVLRTLTAAGAGVGAGALAFPAAALAATPAQYNVQDATYGALGNGSHDDATNIQAAINAANTAGGGIVFFPKGTYIIGTTLTLYSRVSLMGAGVGATSIKRKSGTTIDLVKTYQYDTLVGTGTEGGVEWCGLMDLTLHGNNGASGGGGAGVKHYGRCLQVRNVEIIACAGIGLSSERGSGGDQMESHISGLVVKDCNTDGIDWRGPQDSTFVNCHVINCGASSAGIRVRGGSNGSGAWGGAGTMSPRTRSAAITSATTSTRTASGSATPTWLLPTFRSKRRSATARRRRFSSSTKSATASTTS